MWIKTLMLALAPISALSAPSPEVVDRLQKSFVPGFVAKTEGAGRSLALCRLTDLRLETVDPVTREPGFVQARIYHAKNDSGRTDASRAPRTVILLPPTGGENILDQGYANHLCARGFQVMMLQTWHKQLEVKLDPEMHNEGAVRALSAVRHALDYLRPDRNTQVGILGTSIGAISASLALGFDGRLNTGALIVGGVGFPEIVARSTEQGAAKLREERMKALGITDLEAYVALMKEKVTVEPGDFAEFSGKKKVLAFVGTEDLTVPTANQRDLVRAFGAEQDEFKGDHLETILNTFWWKKGQITRFFEENLR